MLIFNENKFRLKVNFYGGQGTGSPGGGGMSSPDVGGGTNYRSIQNDWAGINADIINSSPGSYIGSGGNELAALQAAAAQSMAQQAQVQQAAADMASLQTAANQSLAQQAQVQSGPPALGGLLSSPMSFLSDLFGYQFGDTPWGTAPPGPMIGAPGNAGDYLNNPLGAVSDGSRGNIGGGGGGGAPPGTTGPAANPGFQINPNQVALDLQGGWGNYQAPQMNPIPTYNTAGQSPFSWNNYFSNFGGK